MVFEVQDGRIARREVRANGAGAVQHGECQGSGSDGQSHGHNHANMGETLKDCEAILCLGMGWRAAEALKSFGIEPLMVQTELPAQEAVEAYLAGSLPTGEGFCRCHH
jgi:predicted Fe-Mo cluster-binding NifX family protein